jgi:hypothetical protein
MTLLAVGPLLGLTKEERLLVWVSVLVGVLLLGAIIIARADRWRKRQMEAKDDEADHVTSFRALYENGELSKEEYERVLRRVAERVGAKARLQAIPSAANNQESAPTPPATEEPPIPPVG